MKNDHQQRLEAIFAAASGMSDRETRERYVRGECAGNEALATEVMEMLHAHDQAGGFLKTIDQTGDQPSVPDIDLKEGPGTIIGRYKLLQKIGEGGFGVVYMAEQEEPVRRRVALKIIKLGMDTRQVIARFEAERQALAMMDHPNIAKVLDAGSTEPGRPFFVMELVRGVAITNYCDQENLGTRQRLELFIDVCRAIQHAHLKGVIHRDIKPSNVMVTLHDGKPVPKVIDFGIAKAIQQRLTERTLFTQYQQFVGTPAYMSPEQAEMSGLDIDTRTDVYALGVMLYELLVGKTPFDSAELIEAGYDEIRRRIREEEPCKPSTRLATFEQQDLTSVARQRGCEPASLTKAIRGDLDWIVMTALEKDRQRRYESPSQLANDVERYLQDQAVQARPPSVAYQIAKFAKRYRLACTAGAITFASLLAGLLFSLYGLTAARKGKVEAQRNLVATEQNARLALRQKERADSEAAAVQRLLYPAILEAATAAVRDGRRTRATKLLAMCPETDRGWEWHWATAALRKPLVDFKGHRTDLCVNDVQFDATGTRIVSAGEDGVVAVWNTSSGEQLTEFKGHGGAVLLSMFSQDGKLLSSIGGDQTYRISESMSGKEIGHSVSKSGNFIKAAIAIDGSRIVTAERNGTVRLWSAGLEAELAVMQDKLPDLSRLAISPDTSRVAAVTQNGRLLVWSKDGEPMIDLSEEGLGFDCVTFSPESDLLATGDQEGRVTIRNAKDGELLRTWKGHARSVGSLAFSPEGTLLVTSGWEGGVAVRDVTTGEELGFFLTDDAHVHTVAFNPKGHQIAVAGQRGSLTLFSLDQLAPPTTFLGHEGLVFECLPTPDGAFVISVGRDGTLRLWDTQTGVEVRRLRGHGGSIYTVDVRADGSQLATRGSDGVLRLWELPSGRLLREQPIDHRVRNLRFSPKGDRLAAGARRRGADPDTKQPAVGIWDVSSGEELVRLEGHLSNVMRMDFHPDGTRLVTTSHRNEDDDGGHAIVWELQTGEALFTLSPEGDAVSNSVLWSNDGRRIYTGHSDGTVCFWNSDTGALERTVYAHGEMVGAIEMSRDGNRLLTSAWYSSEAKLWHADTGELQSTIEIGIPGISDVGFAAHDQAILAAGMDGGLKSLSLEPLSANTFADRRRVQQQASDTMSLENDLNRETLEGKDFEKAVSRLLKAHQTLHRHSTFSRVATQSSHQVAAAALDRAVEKCYQKKRFNEALWAIEQALKLSSTKERLRQKQWIESTRPFIEDVEEPVRVELTRYVGDYQERQFFVRNAQLIYRHLRFEREWPLLCVAPDRFLVVGDETTQLRFISDDPDQTPHAVSGHYFSGGQDLSLRSDR